MNYVVSGQGAPVVLLHGLFGNLDNLKSLGNELEQKHQVIRIDLPNHGQSLHINDLTFEVIIEQLIKVLDKCIIERAHIVGHSMGGKVALAFSLKHPEKCLSVVAADIAPAKYTRRHDTVFHALQSLPLEGNSDRRAALQHLIDSNIDNATSQFLLKNLQRTETGFSWKMNLDGLYNSYNNLIDWPYSQLQYRGPCLFLRGGDSDYVTSEHRNIIISQFPNASAKTIQGTGHWLHAQKPTVFNRIVKEFIEQSVSSDS
ncbi:alpha/beta fold hydrolase [Shewanella sp. 202IG2-18]|uniref:alpha/beta fold hydrolase n=1 Tax=Parashewanella hymeniacidonis TaxID=2807618 RepID=UPI001960D592|nr:alpha/beta fold hydrolase [Parashewanella hymeniacidonis]MBM7072631.1 alpha/beta fold hydrolase [Parashewanella hymeniacidonis]